MKGSRSGSGAGGAPTATALAWISIQALWEITRLSNIVGGDSGIASYAMRLSFEIPLALCCSFCCRTLCVCSSVALALRIYSRVNVLH